MLTKNLARVSLAHLPTPLDEMPRLRAVLGEDCPRLLIKRDDQTGLATGGNKVRKLEFLVADAQQKGADTLITVGGAQSNHCRQTAGAAVIAGMRCVLVLGGDPVPRAGWNGNLLLDDLLGAEVRWVAHDERDKALQTIAGELRAQGAKPYVIPLGGSVPVGAAGYVHAVEEVAQQLSERDETVDRMIVAAGSGGTQAGMLVGVRALGMTCIVEGMNNSPDVDVLPAFKQLAMDTAALLGLKITLTDEDFPIYDALGQHGYGVITAAEREMVRLLARTEGIILDPVYTARAFGQMVNRIKAGVYRRDETLLFWHTGGIGGLFPRAADLL